MANGNLHQQPCYIYSICASLLFFRMTSSTYVTVLDSCPLKIRLYFLFIYCNINLCTVKTKDEWMVQLCTIKRLVSAIAKVVSFCSKEFINFLPIQCFRVKTHFHAWPRTYFISRIWISTEGILFRGHKFLKHNYIIY